MTGKTFNIRRWFGVVIAICMAAVRGYALDNGRSSDNPIVLPADSVYFKSTSHANPIEWGYSEDAGKEKGATIYSRVTLPRKMSLVVHTYGSELICTGIEIEGEGYHTVQRSRDPKSYYDYFCATSEWNGMNCDPSQDCFIAFDLPAGQYEIRTFGKRYYNANPVNGPIKLTVIGFGDDSPSYPDIPDEYIPGTKEHPFSLGSFWSDFSIEKCSYFTENFILGRPDNAPEAWYEFILGCNMDLEITSGVKAHLSLICDTLDVNYTTVGTATYLNMRPGHYLINAGLSDSLHVHFSIKGTIPPPPPDPDLYQPISLFNPSVVGQNYVEHQAFIDANGGYVSDIAHVDGLGRPVQTVQIDASPLGGSIVSHQEYDSCGRSTISWLPAIADPISSSGYVNPADIDYAELYSGDSRPFSEQIYEPTMLSRPVTEIGPGDRWMEASSATRYVYDFNGETGETACICFNVTDTPDAGGQAICVNCSAPEGGSIYYSSGELAVIRTVDEEGNTLLAFTDADGHDILQRRLIGGSYADTYYIYDSYGRLTAVLPPQLSTQISGSTILTAGTGGPLDKYAFLYRYDKLGNLIGKKIPGNDWIDYVYDQMGHAILWRDGNLRSQNRYHFEMTDPFGRVCLVGTCRNIIPSDKDTPETEHLYAAMQVRRSTDPAADALMGYELQGFALSDAEILEAFYYDDYSFVGQYGFPDSEVMGFREAGGFGSRYPDARGQLTGHAVALMDSVADSSASSAARHYLYTATYYDSRDRAIQSVSTNHLGGTDRTLTAYDFAGRAIKTETIHTAPDYIGEHEIVNQWQRSYDNRSRELTVTHRLGRQGQWQTLSSKSYDAIGRLSTDSRGQSVNLTYGYDIRSRLTAISSRLYNQSLAYTLGGNVSRMSWRAFCPDDAERTYRYRYDALGRLVAADYSDTKEREGAFSTAYSYDLNGNILSLSRMGVYDYYRGRTQYGMIDDLTLTYSGNRLLSVTDNCYGPFYQGAYHFVDGADEAVEYTYDANGNTDADLNRGITRTTYDINNRPRSVEFADGSQTFYVYDATGLKLRTVHDVAQLPVAMPAVGSSTSVRRSVTDYCGSYVYEDSLLSRINLEGGYLSFTDYSGNHITEPEYHYYLTDHLGNNHMDVTDDGGVSQAMDYYPFGMTMGSSYMPGAQRWLFGGKELDRTSGLDLYDQEARAYDPTLGRFRNPDQNSEIFESISGYVFCVNDPLAHIDPDGNTTYVEQNSDGTYKVIGGTFDNCNNVVLRTAYGNNKFSYTIIGETLTPLSFFNSDNQTKSNNYGWSGTINPKDQSGIVFLNEFYNHTPDIFYYMKNATRGKKYDFKITNGTGKNYGEEEFYRGMPLGKRRNGSTIYASARDVGNYAAGYIAGFYQISWEWARIAFDVYQSIFSKKLDSEGISTQYAEYVGHLRGLKDGKGKSDIVRMKAFLSLIKRILKCR